MDYSQFPIPKPPRKKKRVTSLPRHTRERVKQRDANACVVCLERGNLQISHTKAKQMGGSRYRDGEENLELRCLRHHDEEHGIKWAGKHDK